MSERAVRRIRVTGRVQGVFFRDWTVGEATRLGLDGWVRNRRDGSVEILAAGAPDAMDTLAALCRGGPPAAQVETVEIVYTAENAPAGFHRAATG